VRLSKQHLQACAGLLDLPTCCVNAVHDVVEDDRLHGPNLTVTGRESQWFLLSSLVPVITA
jgi:hypothetical protein